MNQMRISNRLKVASERKAFLSCTPFAGSCVIATLRDSLCFRIAQSEELRTNTTEATCWSKLLDEAYRKKLPIDSQKHFQQISSDESSLHPKVHEKCLITFCALQRVDGSIVASLTAVLPLSVTSF